MPHAAPGQTQARYALPRVAVPILVLGLGLRLLAGDPAAIDRLNAAAATRSVPPIELGAQPPTSPESSPDPAAEPGVPTSSPPSVPAPTSAPIEPVNAGPTVVDASAPAPAPAEPREPAHPPVEPSVAMEDAVVLAPSQVSASSFISNRRRQHAPERAFDGDPATAWNENESGPGDGAWIAATFADTVTVRRITITTGYGSSSPRHGDLFPLNSHLRRVLISFDGGHTIERDVAEDQRTLVLDNLRVRTRSIRFDAIYVWPGTRWEDLCISEVRVEGATPTPPSSTPAPASRASVDPDEDIPSPPPDTTVTARDPAQRTRRHGAATEAPRCIYQTRGGFHLRRTETISRRGAEEVTTNPDVNVLRAGTTLRGGEGIFYVRLLDDSEREGWMFIPLDELGEGCPRL